MPAASNETMLTQVSIDSSPSAIFRGYLNRSKETLSLYHPQWDLTNEEITSSSDLLKRDGTPICIPPSWDLVQKYAGAFDESADGFDKDLWERGERNFKGDQGEAKFLDMMRNSNHGGVLIGDINNQHLVYGKEITVNHEKAKYMIPNQILQSIEGVGPFQIDFIHFHPECGIYHYEVKYGKNSANEIQTTRLDKTIKQIRKQQEKLEELFKIFCKHYCESGNTQNISWNDYFNCSIACFLNKTAMAMEIEYFNQEVQNRNMKCELMVEGDVLQYKRIPDTNRDDYFEDEIYKNFLIFLAGYRPDFFISPVQCALKVRRNIFSHEVNIENFYENYKKFRNSDRIQNVATTVAKFLENLQFVTNKDIVWDYDNIYLTSQQQDAIGFFDGGGNFSPKQQFIVGPPGSGKSLILMLKIFILGQMGTRNEKKVYYWSGSREYEKKLSQFVSRNKSKFCREVNELEWGEEETVASEGADVIVDEEFGGSFALDCLSSQHEDQFVASVCTGFMGNVTSRNDSDEYYPINMKEFKSRDFLITELQTVFRSTRQIQLFFHKFNFDENKGELISGHNFDGIKVEEWVFDGRKNLKKALEERIRRLIQIEGCEGREIGLFLPLKCEKPQLINNIFYNYCGPLRSLEFPVMIVVEPEEDGIYLCLSRAVCHLIVFTVRSKLASRTTTN